MRSLGHFSMTGAIRGQAIEHLGDRQARAEAQEFEPADGRPTPRRSTLSQSPPRGECQVRPRDPRPARLLRGHHPGPVSGARRGPGVELVQRGVHDVEPDPRSHPLVAFHQTRRADPAAIRYQANGVKSRLATKPMKARMTTSALRNDTTNPTAKTGMSAAERLPRLLTRSQQRGGDHDGDREEEGEFRGRGP